MIQDMKRRLMTEAVIGAGLCLGAHFVLVDPMRQALGSTRSRIGALEAAQSAGNLGAESIPKVLAALEQVRREAAAIEEAGRLARDEGAMFGRIQDLAQLHQVRIEHMEPRQPRPGEDLLTGAPPAARPGVAGGQGSARPGDAALGYAISISGEFADVGAFLDALQNDLGYTVLRSVRISPGADSMSSLLSVVVETAHFAFSASPAAGVDAAAEGGGR